MTTSQNPNNSSVPKTIRLGLWGLPNSGKTVYMTMLYHYLNLSTQWRVLVDEQTLDFVDSHHEQLIEEGSFLPRTSSSTNKPQYFYKLINNQTNESIEITFIDIAGDLFLEKDLEINRQNIYTYFNSCHGIIFFISPLQADLELLNGKSYLKTLSNLLNKMQIHSNHTDRLEQYVAFCITKVDHTDFYETHQQASPEEAILKILGPNINLNWFNNYFHLKIDEKKNKLSDIPNKHNRCKFFYISPFGVYKDKNGAIKSPVEPIQEKPLESNRPIKKRYTNYSQISNNIVYINNTNAVAIGNIHQNESLPISKSEVMLNYKEAKANPQKGVEQANIGYKINTQVAFNPINVLSPIEWIINGIKEYSPNINTTSTNQPSI